MSKHLVVVESPAKAKTIEKYLGQDYSVLASYGHVRDLIPKEGAVDPDNDFAMKYQIIDRNEKHVQAILKALKPAESLLLATDPDREGEAISWHLLELLKDKGVLKDKAVKRVVFHEVTKRAVNDAVANPRTLADDMVDAQQARRALDYLVGFNLSPLLWKKIRRGLSAGRVQSPALRMIVERQLEIEKFEPQEYWSIDAQVDKEGKAFSARLLTLEGKKVEQFTVTDEGGASKAKAMLEKAANGQLAVSKIDKKQRKRNPAPPFITSTLQQEASRKLGFSAQRTMRTAQQLYEGVDIGGEATGLITYMRTDSVNLSQEALDDVRATIVQRYGQDALPDAPRTYKTKSKNAQEAHEAIRPTAASQHPDDVKSYLSADQLKLYTLIWQRTIACQMVHALYNTVALNLDAGGPEHQFRATGSTLISPGFMAVYQEGRDDKEPEEDKERILPPVEEGETLKLLDIITDQHFTEPPPKFSEASLVKALEEHGIGRPSTYATIISTLQNREYVELESRRFTPTDTGRIVAQFLTEHFNQYVDYDFTANLEDQLDAVARGEMDWIPLLRSLWVPFQAQVKEKESVSREEVSQARQLGTDPKSGRPISVRLGRYGPFAQIGTKDDEDKPLFAGLRGAQRMDTITLEEALELFKLPRQLGETEEGDKVSTNIGRFGPYIRYGSKFVSIKGDDDPYTITPERALQLIKEKIADDLAKILKTFADSDIQIIKGRWGPYITDGKKNAKMPKDKEPADMELAECQELIEKAPEKKARKRTTRKKS